MLACVTFADISCSDGGSADYPVEPGQLLLDIPTFRSVL